ncbi:MAG: protocatechuate 3,4-dioxygenase [Gammaproteobacteria bacterium]|nr:protocatechuate 3,4-dioxygenase [Gammaproteobacteria bacterium]
MTTDRIRRNLITGFAGLLLAGPAHAMRRLVPTPQQTTGPFYPEEPPLDDDNDLTRIHGRAGVARGRITDLSGRILDPNGQPLPGMRVEIWQCDATGRYHHPRDRGTTIDQDFQGFGHTRTDSEGNYRFRTIRPVPYPGRTPHIHIAVFAADAPPFVTQLYVRDEPRNAQDFIFNHIPGERRHLVVADFLPAPRGDAELKANFDIVLAGASGTPQA